MMRTCNQVASGILFLSSHREGALGGFYDALSSDSSCVAGDEFGSGSSQLLHEFGLGDISSSVSEDAEPRGVASQYE
jgi:hypothetical protein